MDRTRSHTSPRRELRTASVGVLGHVVQYIYKTDGGQAGHTVQLVRHSTDLVTFFNCALGQGLLWQSQGSGAQHGTGRVRLELEY